MMPWGIGASLLRREDERHLHGRGEFVSDIKLPGTMEVAFLRSPHAHARIRGDRRAARGQGPRLHRRRPAAHQADPRRHPGGRARSRRPGRRSPPTRCAMSARRSPPASRRPAPRPKTSPPPSPSISRCSTRSSMRRATCAAAAIRCMKAGATTSTASGSFEGGDIDAAARAAEITVSREYRMNRQSGAPLEGRAVLAYRDHRLDEIVVYASTQTPHTVRVALGEILGLELRRIRVVAPDVGGGFGPKARLYPEEIILAALALELDHPVRWIEDRSEHLLTVGAYPRPSLQGHRLCRPAGPHPRHRCRDHRRCRRLWAVAAGAVPGSQHGGAQPARPLYDRELPGADLHGRDQQGAARPLSRRRPARRVLCDRAHDRRGRARGRPRPGRGAGIET